MKEPHKTYRLKTKTIEAVLNWTGSYWVGSFSQKGNRYINKDIFEELFEEVPESNKKEKGSADNECVIA